MISTEVLEENSQERSNLEDLFELLGVAASYIDYSGETVAISLENRLRVLGMLGLNISSEDELTELILRYQEAATSGFLEKIVLVTHGESQEVSIKVPLELLEEPLSWSISHESNDSNTSPVSGSIVAAELPESGFKCSGEVAVNERLWKLPDLSEGYYSIRIISQNLESESFLIVSPTRCFEPQWAKENRKLAGLSTHLYTLRSDRDWGIGDFGDLKSLLRNCAKSNLDFVVLNPLHILDSMKPDEGSPYSPFDRRFLNPIYIELEAEPDFIESSPARAIAARSQFKETLVTLRSLEFVDYAGVRACKQELFEAMFKHFLHAHRGTDSSRGRAFSAWSAQKEPSIHEFCELEAARNSENSDCLANPEFHLYLQWIGETQLESCHRLAKSLGMSIGLVRDLAVGGNSTSAEVQLNRSLFGVQASIGSPPDSFAPQGQNWGLPPLHPTVLQETRFKHFIQLLRTNMASCSALRIDHVMALMRLWWCPATGSSDLGGYVRYPVELLFAILRIESQRAQCLIVGEDLGVVPPEIKAHMDTSRVFGNALFYFEKYDGVSFKKPEHCAANTLSMIANHDVPTLSAWWNKSDLALRQELGLYSDNAQFDSAIAQRESDLIQILHWLDEQSLLPDSWRHFNIHRAFDSDLCKAILQANGRSSALLVSTQLDDLCGVSAPVNIPGTSTEYPNWRRKLPVLLNEFFDKPEYSDLLDSFVNARAL